MIDLQRGTADIESTQQWQRALAAVGFVDELGASGIDGDFGPATQRATKAFQRRAELRVTGIVDRPTMRVMAFELIERAAGDEPLTIAGALMAALVGE